MAIVRRRFGSNKRLLTLLPTRKNVKKRKMMITCDNVFEEGDIAPTVVVPGMGHNDENNATTTFSSSCSTPPNRDFRFETVVTPPPPEVKRVRFAQPHPGQKQLAHVVDEDYLQRHKFDLWYPKTHRQEQQQQVQKIISTFKETHPETVSNFAVMYKSLASGNDEKMLSPSSMEALPMEMRGLEWGITPQLKLRRKRHFRHVLQCAEDRSLPESFQQIMRHTTSKNSSRTAVLMARWYAAQHLEAEGLWEKEEEETVAQKLPGTQDSTTSSAIRECCALRQACAVTPMKGLPPRQPRQSKRIRLWER
jgi:hypothetical protein